MGKSVICIIETGYYIVEFILSLIFRTFIMKSIFLISMVLLVAFQSTIAHPNPSCACACDAHGEMVTFVAKDGNILGNCNFAQEAGMDAGRFYCYVDSSG